MTGAALARKEAALRQELAQMDGALVAFSGGVDSSLMLALAAQELGDRAVALTFQGSIFHTWELDTARALAQRLGVDHVWLEAPVLDLEAFACNPPDRCYHCKAALFGMARERARELGLGAVLEGSLAEDLQGHRPGHRAALELGIRQPLLRAGLCKQEVRQLARRLDLPTWDQPSYACLASRFPAGTRIDAARLDAVRGVEELLSAAGLRQFRVRHHLLEGAPMARIELEQADLSRALEPALREDLLRACRSAGYRWVTLDLWGYRTGSLCTDGERS